MSYDLFTNSLHTSREGYHKPIVQEVWRELAGRSQCCPRANSLHTCVHAESYHQLIVQQRQEIEKKNLIIARLADDRSRAARARKGTGGGGGGGGGGGEARGAGGEFGGRERGSDGVLPPSAFNSSSHPLLKLNNSSHSLLPAARSGAGDV